MKLSYLWKISMDAPAADTLPIIPEDSAEWLADSNPTSPLPALPRGTRKRAEIVPESASSISTRRSSLPTQDFAYEKFEGLTERVSERVDKQNCSCACQVF